MSDLADLIDALAQRRRDTAKWRRPDSEWLAGWDEAARLVRDWVGDGNDDEEGK